MSELAEIITQNEDQIRAEWLRDMAKSLQRSDLMSKAELEEQSLAVLNAVVMGVRTSGPTDMSGKGWNTARELLQEISSSRARQGFSPTEVASFVLSLKQPLLEWEISAGDKNKNMVAINITYSADHLARGQTLTVQTTWNAAAAGTAVGLVLLVLAVIGITYGAIVATMQPNLKRIIAYSSIAHLGFVVLGTFALYYHEPKSPAEQDLRLIERATRIAEQVHDAPEGASPQKS